MDNSIAVPVVKYSMAADGVPAEKSCSADCVAESRKNDATVTTAQVLEKTNWTRKDSKDNLRRK